MSEAVLRLVYTGPELEAGEMDVRALAPTLQAVGDICERTNLLINGRETAATVRMRADVRARSFDISLVLDIAGIVNTLMGSDANQLLTTLGFIKKSGSVASGLLSLVKTVGKAEQMQYVEIDEEIEATAPDGRTLRLHRNVRNLYNDTTTVTALDEVLKPLARQGVELFQAMEGSEVVESLDAADYARITEGGPRQIAAAQEAAYEVVQVLEILQPDISGRGYQWRVSDGANVFLVKMEDPGFVTQVTKREPFRSGDQLRVRMSVEQSVDGEGKLHLSRTVTEVIEHRMPRQSELF